MVTKYSAETYSGEWLAIATMATVIVFPNRITLTIKNAFSRTCNNQANYGFEHDPISFRIFTDIS